MCHFQIRKMRLFQILKCVTFKYEKYLFFKYENASFSNTKNAPLSNTKNKSVSNMKTSRFQKGKMWSVCIFKCECYFFKKRHAILRILHYNFEYVISSILNSHPCSFNGCSLVQLKK